jgi:XTP/dITP diphosphohydrolase
MPHRLLIATGNQGKLREFRALFDALDDAGDWELVGPAEVGLEGFEVVEDGDTYAANAGRKARAYANAAGLPSLADDSGLEVDALDGAPGLYSARYAGEDADDAANRAKLLAALDGVAGDQRSARFRCLVGIAFPYTTNVRLGEGVVEGRIAVDERGDLGFGYDPLFELPDGRRMAELSTAEKNRISHRARALADARWALQSLAKTLDAAG